MKIANISNLQSVAEEIQPLKNKEQIVQIVTVKKESEIFVSSHDSEIARLTRPFGYGLTKFVLTLELNNPVKIYTERLMMQSETGALSELVDYCAQQKS
jgi:hypothetical protein